jgi:tripartite-type tricarboxylate transporter receptor subunit TctC
MAVCVLVAATLWTHKSIARDYPTRPIRVITNVGSGGTADIFIRALGEELHRRWGEPLIVDPRPGGNFIIAGRACAESPPDGHTVCLLSGETLNYNQFLNKRLPYDAQKDFAPITNLFFNTQALVINAALGVKSLDELAALARAQPRTLAYVAPSLPHALFSSTSIASVERTWCESHFAEAARRLPAFFQAQRLLHSSGSPIF